MKKVTSVQMPITKARLGLFFVGAAFLSSKFWSYWAFGHMAQGLRRALSKMIAWTGTALGYPQVEFDPCFVGMTGQEYAAVELFLEETAQKLQLETLLEAQKIEKIYGYLASILRYDYSKKRNSAYQAVCTRSVMCAGYAQLFLLFARHQGISCGYVCGWAGQDVHLWNYVTLQGKRRYVDVTWQEPEKSKDCAYLLGTKEQFKKDHYFF